MVEDSRALILCVDDYCAGLEMRKLLLEGNGYRVLTATSGIEALALAKDVEFSAVVLDFRMQEMDGGMVARALRQLRPELPIILFTGFKDEVPESVARSVDAVLSKAENVDMLLDALHHIAERTRRERLRKVH